MRITFGGLFIALGVTLLWLAATGNLDRLGQAWDVVTGKSAPAAGNGAPSAGESQASAALPPMPNIPTRVLEMPSLPSLG